MIKERIPISGDLGSKVKQLMEYAGWQEGPVSYTHLDVYKRQSENRPFWSWARMKQTPNCCSSL